MAECAVFLAEGFEECEALITIDMLRRGGISVDSVSITDNKRVKGSHQVVIEADRTWNEIDPSSYNVLILPGGKAGTKNLEAFRPLCDALRKHFAAGRLTCAICAAPSILGHLGILKGKHYTSFPAFRDDEGYQAQYEMELAVTDGNIITGRGMGATIEFARHILKKLVDQETMNHVEYGIQYEHSFRTLTK